MNGSPGTHTSPLVGGEQSGDGHSRRFTSSSSSASSWSVWVVLVVFDCRRRCHAFHLTLKVQLFAMILSSCVLCAQMPLKSRRQQQRRSFISFYTSFESRKKEVDPNRAKKEANFNLPPTNLSRRCRRCCSPQPNTDWPTGENSECSGCRCCLTNKISTVLFDHLIHRNLVRSFGRSQSWARRMRRPVCDFGLWFSCFSFDFSTSMLVDANWATTAPNSSNRI